MMDYTVFKAKILTNSSVEIANVSLFEILLGFNITRIDNPGKQKEEVHIFEMSVQ